MSENAPPLTLDACRALDWLDPLADWRAHFVLPAYPAVRFDANSVGAMAASVPARLADVQRQWTTLGRRNWAESDWLAQPAALGADVAHLAGAGSADVLVCDNTTLNLVKLLGHAWRLRRQGHRILTEAGNFSADLHAAEGFCRWLEQAGTPAELVTIGSREALADMLDERTAIVMLTHTDYRDGSAWPLAATTERVHAAGALMLWDLSHSMGALDVDLLDAGADFAVSAGYKYLCGGPGGPAVAFIHPSHHDRAWPMLQGWMGHADQPGFGPRYVPAPGVRCLATGTPPVIANAVFRAVADIWRGIDRIQLAARHRALGDTLIRLLDEQCAGLGVELVSPRDPAARGGHVCFRHPGAAAVVNALGARDVVMSFRAPDAIRAGMSPLYHHHEDAWHAVAALRDVLSSEDWRRPEYQEAKL